MPSPIAHIAAGFAICRIRDGRGASRSRPPGLLGACVGLSLLPDLDAALGIALGNLGRYHNNFAGSPAFGALVALVVAGGVMLVRRAWARQALILTFVCYEVHVLMDFLTVGRGVMLLWPLSTERFAPPFHLFFGLRWSHGLASTLHLVTIVTELLFAIALFISLRWLLRRRDSRSEAASTGDKTRR
jgi:hypothetical protein